MLETTHVLAALAAAKTIPNPFLAFLAGLASHFFLDWLPHYDFQGKVVKDNVSDEGCQREFTSFGKKVVWIDFGISMVIFLFLSVSGKIWPDFPEPVSFLNFMLANLNLPLGVLGGILPDIFSLVSLKTGWREPSWFSDFHKKIQEGKEIRPLSGLLFQIVFCSFCLWVFWQ